MEYLIYNEIVFNDQKQIEYEVKEVHDNFIEIRGSNNLLGTADLNGNVLIKPTFYRIDEFGDFYLTNREYRKGLLDKNGFEIIKPKYKDIYTFKNKRAIVRSENGLYGIIDDKGIEIVKPKYNIIRGNNSFIASINNIECVIDINGKIIIDNDKYHYNFLGDNLYEYHKFYDNLKGKSGILSKDKVLTKDKYDEIEYLNEDRFLAEKGVLFKYIIDKNGNKILKLPYMKTRIYPESNVIIVENVNKDCIELVIDGGKTYTSLSQVARLSDFHFNIAIAHMKNGRYTLINSKGEDITDKDFHFIWYDEEKKRFILYNNSEDIEKYVYVDCIVSPDEIDIYNEKKVEWVDYSKYKSVMNLNCDTVITQDNFNTYFVSKDGSINKLDGIYKAIDIKDNYVVLSYHCNRSLYYMLCNLKGEIIIPLLDKKIFMLNNNTLIIDNHIINFNSEYLNFSYKYKLDVTYDFIYNKFVFDTKEECEEYINKVKSWYQEKEKKENELDDYLEKLSGISYEEYIEDLENKKMIKSLERWL